MPSYKEKHNNMESPYVKDQRESRLKIIARYNIYQQLQYYLKKCPHKIYALLGNTRVNVTSNKINFHKYDIASCIQHNFLTFLNTHYNCQ